MREFEYRVERLQTQIATVWSLQFRSSFCVTFNVLFPSNNVFNVYRKFRKMSSCRIFQDLRFTIIQTKRHETSQHHNTSLKKLAHRYYTLLPKFIVSLSTFIVSSFSFFFCMNFNADIFSLRFSQVARSCFVKCKKQ
jgi:hypothetical protein